MKEASLEPAKLALCAKHLLLDFILLTCYFGNDFVPAIPAVSLSLDDSIWWLLEKYAITLTEEGAYMVQSVTDTVFHWNTTFLLKFWNLCLPQEDIRMKLKTQSWTRHRNRRRQTPTERENCPVT